MAQSILFPAIIRTLAEKKSTGEHAITSRCQASDIQTVGHEFEMLVDGMCRSSTKKAQYLNVIESVFSGLKRAVILNSDYGNVYQMQKAISQHFYVRNEYFWKNTERVGHKIWDAELFNLNDFGSGLHKHV